MWGGRRSKEKCQIIQVQYTIIITPGIWNSYLVRLSSLLKSFNSSGVRSGQWNVLTATKICWVFHQPIIRKSTDVVTVVACSFLHTFMHFAKSSFAQLLLQFNFFLKIYLRLFIHWEWDRFEKGHQYNEDRWIIEDIYTCWGLPLGVFIRRHTNSHSSFRAVGPATTQKETKLVNDKKISSGGRRICAKLINSVLSFWKRVISWFLTANLHHACSKVCVKK